MSQSTKRADIHPGLTVDIVLKKDQPTGKLTRGVVKDLLTSKAIHPRGIKVRLTSGQVGRVQRIVDSGTSPLPDQSASTATARGWLQVPPEEPDDDDFDNFI